MLRKIMKRLFLLLGLIPTITFGQTRDKEVSERIDYLKSNPIIVTQLTLDEKAIKKLNDKEIQEAKSEIEKINKNIRTAFATFWDINDTIIFVADKELKAKMKEFRGGIFFELIKLGEYTNGKGQVIPVTAFRLSRPNKADYFKNVVPRPGIDSSLVNIVTELRQLKLNVTTGDVMNKKDLGRKIILINKDDQRNKFGENYVEVIRSKYKGSIIDVDNKFVLDALMRKDPKYIYLKNGSTFNMEDGTMIPLY
jgi:bisphosphoglycerate-dependent phosphoglycerate mutase